MFKSILRSQQTEKQREHTVLIHHYQQQIKQVKGRVQKNTEQRSWQDWEHRENSERSSNTSCGRASIPLFCSCPFSAHVNTRPGSPYTNPCSDIWQGTGGSLNPAAATGPCAALLTHFIIPKPSLALAPVWQQWGLPKCWVFHGFTETLELQNSFGSGQPSPTHVLRRNSAKDREVGIKIRGVTQKSAPCRAEALLQIHMFYAHTELPVDSFCYCLLDLNCSPECVCMCVCLHWAGQLP